MEHRCAEARREDVQVVGPSIERKENRVGAAAQSSAPPQRPPPTTHHRKDLCCSNTLVIEAVRKALCQVHEEVAEPLGPSLGQGGGVGETEPERLEGPIVTTEAEQNRGVQSEVDSICDELRVQRVSDPRIVEQLRHSVIRQQCVTRFAPLVPASENAMRRLQPVVQRVNNGCEEGVTSHVRVPRQITEIAVAQGQIRLENVRESGEEGIGEPADQPLVPSTCFDQSLSAGREYEVCLNEETPERRANWQVCKEPLTCP
mmetsp:Transcript_146107/g.466905  ORF Transcript_146107/g.466905 Transcript_146107/m.466905 type:complete len:259 (-) Transcript_146107:506-1282(-)